MTTTLQTTKKYVAAPLNASEWPERTLKHQLELAQSVFFQFEDEDQCELYIEETGMKDFRPYPIFIQETIQA